MGDDWPFHNLLLLGLLWLGILLYGAWRRGRPTLDQTTPPLTAPIQRRSREPRPFAGLLHKPRCDACEHAVEPRPQAPSAPPPILTFARGRRRQVDTQQQFCPDHDCAYYGWVGRGNIRANGHPGGKP